MNSPVLIETKGVTVQVPITLKMRRTRHGSGTNRTKGYHCARHRHENKRVRVEERAIEEIRKAKSMQVADSPMPLIDIGIDRVGELIKSVTGVFEDSYQDAWVRVLDEHPSSESEILIIAKKACNANIREAITTKHKNTRIEKPIINPMTSKSKATLTLEGVLEATWSMAYSPRTMKEPKTIENLTRCKYCSAANLEHYGNRYSKRGVFQRYWCRECGHTFTDNGAVGKMHYPRNIVQEFVRLRKLGLSFGKIQRNLYAAYAIKLSTQTLLYWGRKLGVLIERTDGHYRRSTSQLIQSLRRLRTNAALDAIDVSTTCGYSPKTSIEQTQLVKQGLISRCKTGWIIKGVTND